MKRPSWPAPKKKPCLLAGKHKDQRSSKVNIQYVDPKSIVIPEGFRSPDAKTVMDLTESIASIGLMSPLAAFYSKRKAKWVLVAGRHRLSERAADILVR